MMDAGNYSAVVTGGVLCETKNGKEQVAVDIEVSHQAVDGEWKKIDTTDRVMFWSLTDAAWLYTEARLKGIGFNGDFDNPNFQDDPIVVECRHEEYQGRTMERWDLAGGQKTERTPVASDVAAKFTARWKQNQKAAAPPMTAPPRNTAPPPPPEPIQDDDIPF